ncbi:hypothetical protein PVAP13_2NG379106 [Panicum virgatum]|uniref:Uncharacterized protein n=1 Tax=Panicum virgatum TaxID=38727 RepID=A0A8T0VLL5_PANVG|nr:hypothetical protein PVAP13_2NG379106 [Panicum virgatum]
MAMQAAKERRERRAADEGDAGQLPTETSPYVRYEDLEDYKMRGYGAQGHLPPPGLRRAPRRLRHRRAHRPGHRRPRGEAEGLRRRPAAAAAAAAERDMEG